MSDSSLIGAAARRGLNVPPADQAILREMIALAERAQSERVRSTAGSLRALLYPDSAQGRAAKAEDHEGSVAVALAKAQAIAEDPTAPEHIRKRAEEDARSLQVTELAKWNAGALAEWERLHPAA